MLTFHTFILPKGFVRILVKCSNNRNCLIYSSPSTTFSLLKCCIVICSILSWKVRLLEDLITLWLLQIMNVGFFTLITWNSLNKFLSHTTFFAQVVQGHLFCLNWWKNGRLTIYLWSWISSTQSSFEYPSRILV